MRRLFGSLLIILTLLAPRGVQADREIPDNNLAYPVLISLSTGSSGSGFFLNMEDSTYLVTASHILFDEASGNLKANQAKLLSYSRNPKETKRISFSSTSKFYLIQKEFKSIHLKMFQ